MAIKFNRTGEVPITPQQTSNVTTTLTTPTASTTTTTVVANTIVYNDVVAPDTSNVPTSTISTPTTSDNVPTPNKTTKTTTNKQPTYDVNSIGVTTPPPTSTVTTTSTSYVSSSSDPVKTQPARVAAPMNPSYETLSNEKIYETKMHKWVEAWTTDFQTGWYRWGLDSAPTENEIIYFERTLSTLCKLNIPTYRKYSDISDEQANKSWVLGLGKDAVKEILSNRMSTMSTEDLYKTKFNKWVEAWTTDFETGWSRWGLDSAPTESEVTYFNSKLAESCKANLDKYSKTADISDEQANKSWVLSLGKEVANEIKNIREYCIFSGNESMLMLATEMYDYYKDSSCNLDYKKTSVNGVYYDQGLFYVWDPVSQSLLEINNILQETGLETHCGDYTHFLVGMDGYQNLSEEAQKEVQDSVKKGHGISEDPNNTGFYYTSELESENATGIFAYGKFLGVNIVLDKNSSNYEKSVFLAYQKGYNFTKEKGVFEKDGQFYKFDDTTLDFVKVESDEKYVIIEDPINENLMEIQISERYDYSLKVSDESPYIYEMSYLSGGVHISPDGTKTYLSEYTKVQLIYDPSSDQFVNVGRRVTSPLYYAYKLGFKPVRALLLEEAQKDGASRYKKDIVEKDGKFYAVVSSNNSLSFEDYKAINSNPDCALEYILKYMEEIPMDELTFELPKIKVSDDPYFAEMDKAAIKERCLESTDVPGVYKKDEGIYLWNHKTQEFEYFGNGQIDEDYFATESSIAAFYAEATVAAYKMGYYISLEDDFGVYVDKYGYKYEYDIEAKEFIPYDNNGGIKTTLRNYQEYSIALAKFYGYEPADGVFFEHYYGYRPANGMGLFKKVQEDGSTSYYRFDIDTQDFKFMFNLSL